MKPEKLGAGYYSLSDTEKMEVLKKISAFLSQQAEIVFAFLYGSFLREKFFRDIDIGTFVKSIDPEEYFNFENSQAYQLEQKLGFLLPMEVKIINQAPISFRFEVIRGTLLFSRDEALQADFMEATARKYLDMGPVRRHYLREAIA
jgi:hypothetical protein